MAPQNEYERENISKYEVLNVKGTQESQKKVITFINKVKPLIKQYLIPYKTREGLPIMIMFNIKEESKRIKKLIEKREE